MPQEMKQQSLSDLNTLYLKKVQRFKKLIIYEER